MDDLRQRLRRLGLVKGTQELNSPARPRGKSGVQGQVLPPGHEVETPSGVCFYIEKRYPLEHLHGHSALGAVRDHDRVAAGQMATQGEGMGQEGDFYFELERALFVDTETTGLGHGAGVLAFLIGVGFFEQEGFVLRQYFLRDPAEEPAALQHLADWSEGFAGLVSFNGRGFDVPILRSRFILSRLRAPILRAPHLDLLHPARRLWRDRLESCSLGSLEQHILGVQRNQDDIMSWLIPDLYRQYLRGGDNGEMRQVLYHNEVDILSLVVLAERLCGLFAHPLHEKVDPRERVALARWFEALGLTEQAESTYQAALEGWLPLTEQHICLKHLAALLKRQQRRAEAVPLWVQWAMEDQDQVEAHVELAKFYEWHEIELEKALAWTQQALNVVAKWSKGPRKSTAVAELRLRQSRLQRKRRSKAS